MKNMIKKRGYILAAALIVLVVLVCLSVNGTEAIRQIISRRSKLDAEKPVVVIDAGHGGFDPGKIGVNDALEKDINLAVAVHLKELLEQNDVEVVMTRTSDAGLYDENEKNKKAADLKRRVALIEEADPVLAVSIHQNSFTSSESYGAQVFYYSLSETGKRLADCLQETLKREMKDGNHRVAKGNDSYYMLKNVSCPLVIMECGFLSNRREADLLITDEYQRKMAWVIHLGLMEWLNSEKHG